VNPTKKQLELLQVLNPYKRKMVYWEAAEILGVGLQAVKDRMFRLKRRCPEVYRNFKQLQKDMAAGQRALDRARTVNPEDFKYFDIKERF